MLNRGALPAFGIGSEFEDRDGEWLGDSMEYFSTSSGTGLIICGCPFKENTGTPLGVQILSAPDFRLDLPDSLSCSLRSHCDVLGVVFGIAARTSVSLGLGVMAWSTAATPSAASALIAATAAEAKPKKPSPSPLLGEDADEGAVALLADDL